MQHPKRKQFIKRALYIILFVIVFTNILLVIQAYSFTHFTKGAEPLTEHTQLPINQTIKMLFTGAEIPRPETVKHPKLPYNTIRIPAENGQTLEAWIMRTTHPSKALVILFHGYMDSKAQMLDYAYNIMEMEYDVMLVDFMGAGGSYGNQTTIGYKEGENVKQAFEYARNELKEKRIFLLGFSMGAAAIFKAQHDYNLPVCGIISEASYGTFYGTIKARASLAGANALSGISAGVMVFWINATNSINAFDMNPEEYAKNIIVPTLVACGGKDQYIRQDETMRIFDNLASKNKRLKFYPKCRHELYSNKYDKEWQNSVSSFLNSIN